MREEQVTIRMVQRKGKILLNGPKAMKPSLIGKADKIPSGMFITTHFNRKKENTRYIQPSIMQHKITFIREFYHPNLILHSTKFKYGKWSFSKHLTSCC